MRNTIGRWCRACLAAGVAVVTLTASGCGEDPAEPAVLAQRYTLVTADGHALPWEGYTILPSHGGCRADLLGGDIMFYSATRFDFYMRTRTECAEPNPPTSLERSYGTYTRSGDRIELSPELQSSWTLENIRLSGSRITATATRASGTRLELVFRAQE